MLLLVAQTRRTKRRRTLTLANGQHSAPSASRVLTAQSGLAGHSASHASQRRIAERDSWFPNLGFRCRRWHPAKTPRVLRIASSVLHILSQTNVAPYRRFTSPRAKGSAGTFSARKSPKLHLLETKLLPETRFSKALSQVREQTNERTHGIQQARMNSRNQTTIATHCKHRQPMFCSGTDLISEP